MTSTYFNNVPQPGTLLRVSQGQLLNNAQALDNIFGVDHVEFSNTTDSQGFHNQLSMTAQTSVVTPDVADTIRVFSKLIGSQPFLYGTRTDGSTVPVQPISNLATPGYIQLGSALLKFGTVTGSSSTSGTASVDYDSTVAFTDTPWITIGCLSSTNGTGSRFAFSFYPTSGFETTSITVSWNSDNGAVKTFNYIAIGPA